MERRESSDEVAKRGFALYCGVTLLVDFFFSVIYSFSEKWTGILSFVDYRNVQLIYQVLCMCPG